MIVRPVFGLFAVTIGAAIAAPALLGSLGFRANAFAFKPEKMSPLAGLKRMFSTHGLIELCKSMAILAAIRATDADAAERRAAISAAKVQLSVGGRLVTQQAIQLHGGIGVTDEAPVSHYFKRMTVISMMFGDADHCVARFSDLMERGA